MDNGQHLMLGCYHETFAFLARIGARDRVQVQPDLEVPFVDPAGTLTTLRCPPLPSPLHLLAGVLEWDALGWRDRLSAFRLAAPLRRAQRFLATGKGYLPASDGETVENWLIRNGQTRRLREMLWEPLALAALNQSPREAAAPPFVRVLAQMFGPDPATRRSRFRCGRCRPSTPSRPARSSRRAAARCGRPARRRSSMESGRVARVEVRGERIDAPAVVFAVPWFALADALAGDASALAETIARRGAHRARRPSSP